MAVAAKGTVVYRQELTPTSFLERSGTVHAERTAVIDGDRRYNYREWRSRARCLASALRRGGLRKDDRVAFLAFNSEPLLLGHFGVPQAGGVIVAINTRLSPDEIAYILEHSGASMVFFSPELEGQLAKAPAALRRVNLGTEFEDFLATGSEDPVESWLEDEYEVLAIDYTSGTTGRPKGVMYHHRGAYLNALAMALDLRLDARSRYLWTLPMFHCNGWTFTWGVTAVGATNVCIPRIHPPEVWNLFRSGEATAFCAAPTVLIMLVNDPAAGRLETPVRLFTAGAPPSPTLIGQMDELNFQLEHVYGLTETYGPFTAGAGPHASPSGSSQRGRRRGRGAGRRGP
jgi:fatty-acyl-CoA synthase